MSANEKTIAMTPGREPWGHQVIENVPISRIAEYRGRGWRVYGPDWENRPPEILNPLWWLEALWRRITR